MLFKAPRTDRCPRLLQCGLIGILLLCWTGAESAQIGLRQSYLRDIANRAVVTVDFGPEKITKNIHTISKGGKDGDIHAAGRPTDVDLMTVVEIINARQETPAVKELRDATAAGTELKVTGAWRIWCEHGAEDHIQGTAIDPPVDSGADHVFEIHPITKLGQHQLTHAAEQIPGYQYYDTDEAFQHYEGIQCQLRKQGAKVFITTPAVGYNYSECLLQLRKDKPSELSHAAASGHPLPPNPIAATGGGKIAYCRVFNLDGDLKAEKRRAVFLPGTTPETVLGNLEPDGKVIHAYVIPRINLATVNWRVGVMDARPEVKTWNLPYELIVVGVKGSPEDLPEE